MTNTMNDTKPKPYVTEAHLRDIRALLPHGGTRRAWMTVCLNYFAEGDPSMNVEQSILAFNALLPDRI